MTAYEILRYEVWPGSKYAAMGSFIFLRWVRNEYHNWFLLPDEWCKVSFLLLWLHRRQSKLKYQRKTTWYFIGVWWSSRKSSRIWQTTNFSAKNLTWWFLIISWKTMHQMSLDFSLNCMWVADSLQRMPFFSLVRNSNQLPTKKRAMINGSA